MPSTRRPRTAAGAASTGRDALTGWGRLDVAAALEALAHELPPADAYETNDDAGERAYRLFFRGASRRLAATLDYWDDQSDVYAVRLGRGQALYAGLSGDAALDLSLAVWSPATERVDDLRHQELRVRAVVPPRPRASTSPTARPRPAGTSSR